MSKFVTYYYSNSTKIEITKCAKQYNKLLVLSIVSIQYKMSILSIITLLNLYTVSCAFPYSGQSALKNGGTNIPDKNTAMNKVYITNIYIHSDATMIT